METMVDSQSNPEFYKVYIPEQSSHRLRIPPHFVRLISEEVTDKAILNGPWGSNVHVKVCKNESGMYLGDGWQSFLNDHSIRDNEFLLFRYDGNMCFNVQIFDKNGCGRTGAQAQQEEFDNGCDINVEPVINPNQESALSSGKRRRGRPRKKPIVLSLQKIDSGTGENTHIIRRQPPTAESFISKFPNFKISLLKFSVRGPLFQTIPPSFAREHLPPTSRKIFIRGEGRSWQVLCTYKDKRHAFSKGWAPFVRGNKIKVGDICLFELVAKHEMQFHILCPNKKD